MQSISNRCIFYDKSSEPISQKMYFTTNVIEHTLSEEENILYKYRNNIHVFDISVTDYKNWEYYKKIVNPYELVYTSTLYRIFPSSVCILKPLSRSYFKMIELLHIFNCFKEHDVVKSAHVCEGPGGFIEALFDASNMHGYRISTSIAMTLKSKNGFVPGWKKANAFLKKHNNVKILYGFDNTGNIMRPENQQCFIDYSINSSYGGKVDIFTADGGFDFSDDYAKQEDMIFPLLVASTKIGFEVLKPGGCFILKIFDFYHRATTDLLYILSYHFKEWTLYKPCMSRPCNPECYFMGKGFIGCTGEVSDAFRIWCMIFETGAPLNALLEMQYPDDFKERICSLRRKAFETQCEHLQKVFNIIDMNDDAIVIECLKNNVKVSTEWCKQLQMPINVL
jgi:23S rRNA U2552 (ribose-2'-O)-methylase RlmE/FtsJ